MEAMIKTILDSCCNCNGTGVIQAIYRGVCFACNGFGQITVKVSNTKPRQFKINQLVIYKGQNGQVLSWSTRSFPDGSWSQAVHVAFLPDGKQITFDIETAQELETYNPSNAAQSSLKDTINQ
jgi:hypothetical protein